MKIPLPRKNVIYGEQLLPEASFGLRVLSLPACVCLSVCARNNSWPVQVSITKFWPDEQNNLVKNRIVFGEIDLDLQSQIYLQSQILPNSDFEVYPHDNSSPIQAKITKFGAEVWNALP